MRAPTALHLHHLFSKQMINPRGKILSQAIIFPGLWATVCQFVRLHLLVQHGTLCGKHCCLLILPSAGSHFLFQKNPQLPVHRGGEHMNSAHPLSTTSGHLDSWRHSDTERVWFSLCDGEQAEGSEAALVGFTVDGPSRSWLESESAVFSFQSLVLHTFDEFCELCKTFPVCSFSAQFSQYCFCCL